MCGSSSFWHSACLMSLSDWSWRYVWNNQIWNFKIIWLSTIANPKKNLYFVYTSEYIRIFFLLRVGKRIRRHSSSKRLSKLLQAHRWCRCRFFYRWLESMLLFHRTMKCLEHKKAKILIIKMSNRRRKNCVLRQKKVSNRLEYTVSTFEQIWKMID